MLTLEERKRHVPLNFVQGILFCRRTVSEFLELSLRSFSGMTARAVSKEATKLTVSFSKPPTPSVDVRDPQLSLEDN